MPARFYSTSAPVLEGRPFITADLSCDSVLVAFLRDIAAGIANTGYTQEKASRLLRERGIQP